MIQYLTQEQIRVVIALAEKKDLANVVQPTRTPRTLEELETKEDRAWRSYVGALPNAARREVAELYYLGTGTIDRIDPDFPNRGLSDDQIAKHIGAKSHLAHWLRKGVARDADTSVPVFDNVEVDGDVE